MPEIAFRVRDAKPRPSNETKVIRAWREAVAEAARRASGQGAFTKPTASSRFALSLRFRMTESAPGQKSDLDNLAKPVLDTLFLPDDKQAREPGVSGVLFDIDDSQVFWLELEKTHVSSEEEEGVDVRVVWE